MNSDYCYKLNIGDISLWQDAKMKKRILPGINHQIWEINYYFPRDGGKSKSPGNPPPQTYPLPILMMDLSLWMLFVML